MAAVSSGSGEPPHDATLDAGSEDEFDLPRRRSRTSTSAQARANLLWMTFVQEPLEVQEAFREKFNEDPRAAPDADPAELRLLLRPGFLDKCPDGRLREYCTRYGMRAVGKRNTLVSRLRRRAKDLAQDGSDGPSQLSDTAARRTRRSTSAGTAPPPCPPARAEPLIKEETEVIILDDDLLDPMPSQPIPTEVDGYVQQPITTVGDLAATPADADGGTPDPTPATPPELAAASKALCDACAGLQAELATFDVAAPALQTVQALQAPLPQGCTTPQEDQQLQAWRDGLETQCTARDGDSPEERIAQFRNALDMHANIVLCIAAVVIRMEGLAKVDFDQHFADLQLRVGSLSRSAAAVSDAAAALLQQCTVICGALQAARTTEARRLVAPLREEATQRAVAFEALLQAYLASRLKVKKAKEADLERLEAEVQSLDPLDEDLSTRTKRRAELRDKVAEIAAEEAQWRGRRSAIHAACDGLGRARGKKRQRSPEPPQPSTPRRWLARIRSALSPLS